MSRVTLTPFFVFRWTCPACNAVNEHRGRVIRDADDVAAISEQVGQDFEVGDLVTWPDQVACPHCENVYDTNPPPEEP